MQTRSGNVYRYDVARPTLEKKVEQPKVAPKVEKRVEPKVEKRVEPKVEVKVEPKVEVKIESTLNSARKFASAREFARRPSGFIIPPSRISDELAKFLNVPAGTLLARTQVSKLINEYIRNNNLQSVNDNRVINVDAKLRKLLNAKPTDEVTYFNLQRFMKPHFTRD
jgi:hypothetical protein